LLLLAARRPATSEAAIEALGQLASSSELAEMATGEPSLRLRTRLLAVVLERGDPASLSVFLRCVALRATRAAALAAVESIESIERLPMEALFDNLCQDHPAERLAAARVLGKINDEKTTDRLIGMAVDGVCYEGALAALTTSDAPEASRFLRRAQRDARFLNAVQSARFQMQTL
jgi:HEAT repeat protein